MDPKNTASVSPEAKKLKQQQELRKKEEERKRREEEEQRKKMEGGLDQLLGQFVANTSAPHVSACGMELGCCIKYSLGTGVAA